MDESLTSLGRDPDAPDEEQVGSVEMRSTFVFRLRDSLYALEASDVRHVALEQEPLRVPTAPSHVLGIVHVRSSIVTVVDVAAVLGLSDPGTDEAEARLLARRLVVVDIGGTPFGLVADEVLGVEDVPRDQIHVGTQHEGSVRAGLIEGHFDVTDGSVTLLRGSHLLEALVGARNRDPRSETEP